MLLVTSGPGATNAVTPLADALMDSIPLVCITGQVPTALIGSDAFQECDTSGVTRPCTKHNYLVKTVEALVPTVREAFHVAAKGRPGPVVISLPEDMLYEEASSAIPARVSITRPAPAIDAITTARSMLEGAERPMVIAGGSVWDDGSIADLSRFAASFGVPVACSFRRQRLMNNLDPHYAGDLGLGCNPALLERIRGSDCLILLGGRLSEIPAQSRINASLSGIWRKASLLKIMSNDPSSKGRGPGLTVRKLH